MPWEYYASNLESTIERYKEFYAGLRRKKNGDLYKLSMKNQATYDYLTMEIKRNFYHCLNIKTNANLSIEEFESKYTVESIIAEMEE